MTTGLRALSRARRKRAIARWKMYRTSKPCSPFVGEDETRDEILIRATRMMALMQSLKRGPHARSKHEIRTVLRDVAFLRTTAMQRERIDPRGKAFYVTIRSGTRHGLLYGPFPTQAAALRALPEVRNVAHDVNPGDAAFAAFGTASIDAAAARPGKLNAYLPELPPLPAAPTFEQAAAVAA